MKTIGILGAGKVGIVLAQLAIKAGYTVYIAGSGDPEKIALTIKVLVPGAHAVTKEVATEKADIAILAVPPSKYQSLPVKELSGKIVIDAMNHWYEVDGPRSDTIPDGTSSSEAVQQYLQTSRVVKALSHMGYHELHDMALPPNTPVRKAIAVAGDDADALNSVATFVDTIGFTPVVLGALAQGIVLEPGHVGFGTNLSEDALRAKLAEE